MHMSSLHTTDWRQHIFPFNMPCIVCVYCIVYSIELVVYAITMKCVRTWLYLSIGSTFREIPKASRARARKKGEQSARMRACCRQHVPQWWKLIIPKSSCGLNWIRFWCTNILAKNFLTLVFWTIKDAKWRKLTTYIQTHCIQVSQYSITMWQIVNVYYCLQHESNKLIRAHLS